jgi:hypothetical protein
MLDIRFIRQNEDIVKMAAERRGVTVPLSGLLTTDDARLAFTKEQHDTSDYVACIAQWRQLMAAFPNIPDISAPQTTTEVDRVGEVQTEVDTAALWYTRDATRVYTQTGSQLLESVASYRESFFAARQFSPRIVVGHIEDISHPLLLERPATPCALLALGAEYSAEHTVRSSVARLLQTCTASHSASVAVFEAVRTLLEELCTSLHIPYTLSLVAVPEMPNAAVKMYRLAFLADSTPLVLAEWYYEHDFTARRYGILYTDEGKKKYAHTVRVNLGEAHAWLVAIVSTHTRGSVCTLPVPLHSRFADGVISL